MACLKNLDRLQVEEMLINYSNAEAFALRTPVTVVKNKLWSIFSPAATPHAEASKTWLFQQRLECAYLTDCCKTKKKTITASRISDIRIAVPVNHCEMATRFCYIFWGEIPVKGLMTWPKVSSHVFRFWSLSWTNGLNAQFKWKLKCNPIRCAYLEPSATHFAKITQSCWCLHWFLGFGADVLKILLQVHTRPVVTQVCIEKMFNKNIETGF